MWGNIAADVLKEKGFGEGWKLKSQDFSNQVDGGKIVMKRNEDEAYIDVSEGSISMGVVYVGDDEDYFDC